MAIKQSSGLGRKKIVPPTQKKSTRSNSKRSNVSKFVTKRKAPAQKFISPKLIEETFGAYAKIGKRQVISPLATIAAVQALPWIILCGAYSCLISGLAQWGILPEVVYGQTFSTVVFILTAVLGLLLASIIVTLSDRFNLGRERWETMLDVVRDLVGGMWLYVETHEPQEEYEKESSVKLVSAFILATRLHLRQGSLVELKPLLSQLEYKRLQISNHAPLDITFWLSDYLKSQYEQERINIFQFSEMQNGINRMVELLGECEKIARIGSHRVKSNALKILSVVYFLILPLGLVGVFGWQTAFAVTLVSSIYLSLDKIKSNLENPFSRDCGNIYLDRICNTIQSDVSSLIQQSSPNQPQVLIDLPQKVA